MHDWRAFDQMGRCLPDARRCSPVIVGSILRPSYLPVSNGDGHEHHCAGAGRKEGRILAELSSFSPAWRCSPTAWDPGLASVEQVLAADPCRAWRAEAVGSVRPDGSRGLARSGEWLLLSVSGGWSASSDCSDRLRKFVAALDYRGGCAHRLAGVRDPGRRPGRSGRVDDGAAHRAPLRSLAPAVSGLAIIAAGLIALLDNFGVVNGRAYFRYWPSDRLPSGWPGSGTRGVGRPGRRVDLRCRGRLAPARIVRDRPRQRLGVVAAAARHSGVSPSGRGCGAGVPQPAVDRRESTISGVAVLGGGSRVGHRRRASPHSAFGPRHRWYRRPGKTCPIR